MPLPDFIFESDYPVPSLYIEMLISLKKLFDFQLLITDLPSATKTALEADLQKRNNRFSTLGIDATGPTSMDVTKKQDRDLLVTNVKRMVNGLKLL